MLLADRITKSFDGVTACKDVCLRIDKGEILVIRGRNGSGKTTLINLIAGSMNTDCGHVRVGDTDVTSHGAVKRARAGIGRSFQWPQTVPEWTVDECIGFAASSGAPAGCSGNWNSLVADVAGLAAWRYALASSLSASNHKLLDLAMTIARRPSVLLLDEPCATLTATSIPTVTRILDWARTLWHPAILVVEHREELLSWAGRAPRCETREMLSGTLLQTHEKREGVP